jgi:hypothetical protein
MVHAVTSTIMAALFHVLSWMSMVTYLSISVESRSIWNPFVTTLVAAVFMVTATIKWARFFRDFIAFRIHAESVQAG